MPGGRHVDNVHSSVITKFKSLPYLTLALCSLMNLLIEGLMSESSPRGRGGSGGGGASGGGDRGGEDGGDPSGSSSRGGAGRGTEGDASFLRVQRRTYSAFLPSSPLSPLGGPTSYGTGEREGSGEVTGGAVRQASMVDSRASMGRAKSGTVRAGRSVGSRKKKNAHEM